MKKSNSNKKKKIQYATFPNDIMNTILCSNKNRVGILHILRNSPGQEMQAEKIANRLGISHRTALYHLSILLDCGLVEIRKYRKKGERLLRSVWGINKKNKENVDLLFSKVVERFDMQELNYLTSKNVARRGNLHYDYDRDR